MLLLAAFDWNHFWDITFPLLVALALKTYWDWKKERQQIKSQKETKDSVMETRKVLSEKQDLSIKNDKIIADKADVAAQKAQEAVTEVKEHNAIVKKDVAENTEITKTVAGDVATVKQQTNGILSQIVVQIKDDIKTEIDKVARRVLDRVDIVETKLQNLTERVDGSKTLTKGTQLR